MPSSFASTARLKELGLGAFSEKELGQVARQLRLLVLFGSRARGQNHAGSDWDFGYLAAPDVDVEALRAYLSKLLSVDEVDLVDLNRASGVLRHQVADQGIAVFEAVPNTFTDYVIEVLRFWLDVEPIVRASQQAQLRSLG